MTRIEWISAGRDSPAECADLRRMCYTMFRRVDTELHGVLINSVVLCVPLRYSVKLYLPTDRTEIRRRVTQCKPRDITCFILSQKPSSSHIHEDTHLLNGYLV